MKPWEETWEWHPRAGGGARLYSDNHSEEWATAWGEGSNDRLKLAAAAPEMARMLLEFARIGHEWECPSCEADLFVATEVEDGEGLALHTEDCRLMSALRKAGVDPG